jgi:hypothetical protein
VRGRFLAGWGAELTEKPRGRRSSQGGHRSGEGPEEGDYQETLAEVEVEVEVTIRVPSDTRSGRRQQETRAFGTTRRELLGLADWLRSWGVATSLTLTERI